MDTEGVIVQVNTTRFGAVEISNDDLIYFKEGLLGFGNLHNFVLLDDPNEEIFAWLQSAEAPEIAFPVLEPELFMPDFRINLTKKDLETLDTASEEPLRYFTIVTIPDDPTQMTANIKAPIVVNVKKRIARQCVLQDHTLNIREPIFSCLQQRVAMAPIRSQVSDWGVAVTLNGGDKGQARKPELSP